MRGRTHRSRFPWKRPFALDATETVVSNWLSRVMQPTHIAAPSVSRSRRPLDRLGAEIVALASQLTAASARLTRLIGEFDDAEGWGEGGMRSTAHRLSTPESDAFLASMARHTTGAQIEQLARAARRARTGEQAREQYAAAYLKFTVADDGTVTGSFRLPPAEGGELVQALEAGAGRLPDYDSENPEATPGKGRKQVATRGYAWVLTAMTQHFLDALIGQA